MASQFRAVGDLAIPIAHIYALGISLKVIRKNLMSIAKNPQTIGPAKIIAVSQTVIAVPKGQLRTCRIQKCIIAVDIAGRFVGNKLIFTTAPDEQIVFNQSASG